MRSGWNHLPTSTYHLRERVKGGGKEQKKRLRSTQHHHKLGRGSRTLAAHPRSGSVALAPKYAVDATISRALTCIAQPMSLIWATRPNTPEPTIRPRSPEDRSYIKQHKLEQTEGWRDAQPATTHLPDQVPGSLSPQLCCPRQKPLVQSRQEPSLQPTRRGSQ